MKRALVIAYGNPLRGDDGAAWSIANDLRRFVPDSVRILQLHQLSPEAAEPASKADLVIFVDAAAHGSLDTVRCLPVVAKLQATRFWHHVGPEAVLGLCGKVYAAHPQGFLITVPGEQFDYGFTLSASAQNAVPRAVDFIHSLLARHGILHAENPV